MARFSEVADAELLKKASRPSYWRNLILDVSNRSSNISYNEIDVININLYNALIALLNFEYDIFYVYEPERLLNCSNKHISTTDWFPGYGSSARKNGSSARKNGSSIHKNGMDVNQLNGKRS